MKRIDCEAVSMTVSTTEELVSRRKKDFKPSISSSNEIIRRRDALQEQQKEDREKRIDILRQLAMGGHDDDHEEIRISKEEVENLGLEQAQSKKPGNIRRYLYFASQLMTPDWLVTVPPDVGSQWLVQLRPEGSRGLLILQGGTATLRGKSGRVIGKTMFVSGERFPVSELTMLDVVIPDTVIDGQRNCIFVMDVIFWDGTDITCADAECRHFWLASRFKEMESNDVCSQNELPPLIYVPAVDASAENIRLLYESPASVPSLQEYITEEFLTNLAPDSLVFSHKAGKYWSGLTPLQLCWRDKNLSRFVIDTPDQSGEIIPRFQTVIARLDKNDDETFKLVSWDDKEILNGIPSGALPQGVKVRHLIRATVTGIGEDGFLTGLQKLERVPSTRLFPDSFSRVLTQFWRRRGAAQNFEDEERGEHTRVDLTPTIEEICEIAANPYEVMDLVM